MTLLASPYFRWLFLGLYFLAVSSLHLQVSFLLISPVGSIVPAEHGTFGSVILLLILVSVIVSQAVRGTERARTFIFWGLWLGTVVFSEYFFVLKRLEYIHYPQYAFLAILLGLCLDPSRKKFPIGRILFWTTLLGIADEINQYFFLCSIYGDYLDFNDFFLNLQGAMAGILLYYGFRRIPEPSSRERDKGNSRTRGRGIKRIFLGPEGVTVLSVLVVCIVFAMSGRLQIRTNVEIPPGGIGEINGKKVFFLERKPGKMDNWNQEVMNREYYVLGPAKGLILLMATGFVFFAYGWRRPRVNDH